MIIRPVSCHNILLTCDNPTASELCQKSWIIQKNLCVWRPLVQPKVPWSRTFQAQTDLNSSIFSIGIILTSKPKQDFCVKSKSWSYEDGGYFFRFWANVRCAVKMRRQRNHHYLKWIQSSLEGKKNLICCRLFTASKKNHMP